MKQNKPYKRAVLGGTFDRFHEGHRLLLETAGHIADSSFIGIVSDELGKSMFKSKQLGDKIEAYQKRMQYVTDLAKLQGFNFNVDALYDPWGPAITDPIADVIVVSRETRKSADTINEIRAKNGLAPLDIVTIPWYKNEQGEILSSTLKRLSE